MNEINTVTITGLIVLFSLVSGRLQRSPLTPPMVFTIFGLMLSPVFFNLMKTMPANEHIHMLAEITLILVLFTDAARIDLGQLIREHTIPIRLLSIGMPLTIVMGAVIAASLFSDFNWWECAILAIILAPTDAALGQAVVSSSKVPVRIRQALNVESGLNDGIALPVILIFISLSSLTSHTESASYWLFFTSKQIVLGPLMGGLIGYSCAKLLQLSIKHQWTTDTFRDLSIMAVSFLAYFAAELIGGNGFIAAFVAGLTLGNTVKNLCTCLYDFAGAEGQLLNLMVFLFFGLTMVPVILEGISFAVVIYSVLSLTVIRMLPVFISLLGSKLRWETAVFIGWFGPRGLASILFALLVIEHSDLIHRQEILTIVLTTVLMSIFLHGASANIGTVLYQKILRVCISRGDSIAAEQSKVTEMPVRLPIND